MKDENFIKISEVILEKSGIELMPRDKNRVALAVDERRKIQKAKSFKDYINILNYQHSEFNKLICDITVPETYFFRDNNQCNAFKNHIIPALIKTKKKRILKIWSAGCSTGEEAYTIALIIKSIPDLARWNVKIIGTDINEMSLKKARKGVYTRNSFRGCESLKKSEDFIKKPEGWAVKDYIKDFVNFQMYNIKLNKEELFLNKYNDFDIIFCRNVFIYLQKDIYQNILKGFYNSLNKNGFLILGHSEVSMYIKKLYKQLRINNTFIYSKKNIEASEKVESVKKTQKKLICNKEKSRIQIAKKNYTENSENVKKQENSESYTYSDAVLLYHAKDYVKANKIIAGLLKINKCIPDYFMLAALIQINLKNNKKSIEYIQKIKKIDEFSPEIYFLTGIINESEKKIKEAIKSYKTAVFLDNNFFMSYVRLGYLYNTIGQAEASVKSFQAALNVIKYSDEKKISLLSGGFSKKSLESICHKSI